MVCQNPDSDPTKELQFVATPDTPAQDTPDIQAVPAEVVYEGKHYTMNSIAKIAVYNNLFLFTFPLLVAGIILRHILLFAKLEPVWGSPLLVFYVLTTLYVFVILILLRRETKENTFLSILLSLLILIPVVRLVIVVLTVKRAGKRLRSAPIQVGRFNHVPRAEIRRLSKTYGLKAPKLIGRVTAVYSVLTAVLTALYLVLTILALDQLYLQSAMFFVTRMDLETYARHLRASAELGNPQAQTMLGDLSMSLANAQPAFPGGKGAVSEEDSKRNAETAVGWYRMAAEQGYAVAQFTLGACYMEGKGVNKDPVEALKWWQKAAEQGFAEAQYRLAMCLEKGDGVEKNEAEAKKWYSQVYEAVKKEADNGDAASQSELGTFYMHGICGIEADYAEALKWFRKAADQGLPYAQYAIGICYMEGKGVEKDEAEAEKWWRKAADNGSMEAFMALRDLEK